jgi:radical SAM protein with 4Fe4S-binding SPASM domain
MNKCLNALTVVNVELTSRCNKDCWMCGRRKIDREYPHMALDYGDMDFELVRSIASQLPDDIVVQLHNNGEPLLYPRFAEAADLFSRQIRCMDTNGKLIMEKADSIIGCLDTMTVSTFENDEEAERQYEIIKRFLNIKGARKPNVVIRCLGEMNLTRYRELGCVIATRILHSPMGSFKYQKTPTIPETGICLDLLSHMVIRRDGKVSTCVRLDPLEEGIIGDCTKERLADIWNSAKRKERIKFHIEGKRDKVPLCSRCEFWGVPTGTD